MNVVSSRPLGDLSSPARTGGYSISTHDSLALALASVAPPRPMGAWPAAGATRYATAVKQAIKRRLHSLAPGREWSAPDVAAPGDTFIDVTVAHITPSRVNGARDGRSCVLRALHQEEGQKRAHYMRELAPGGPLAPGTGSFVPFAVTDGGLFGPGAIQLLRRWARRQAGPSAADEGRRGIPDSFAPFPSTRASPPLYRPPPVECVSHSRCCRRTRGPAISRTHGPWPRGACWRAYRPSFQWQRIVALPIWP